ncbi:MAG: exostosin family protein [Solirubrobacteraceae bacterium]
MRVHVATAGETAASAAARDTFIRLAQADTVGAHELDDDPASSDVLLFVDLHCHDDDVFQRRLRQHPLVRSHKRKAYVYDQRDRPVWSLPGIYVCGSPRWARRYKLLVGGPYASLTFNDRPVEREPDLLFSFIGSRTHPVRERILQLRHARALIEDTGAVHFRQLVAEDRPDQARYGETLARSKFVLCPRGYGPATMRLYEVLQTGRVPVIISDEWLPPAGVDWSSATVRVAERDVERIPSILEALEDDWPVRSSAAQELARAFSHARLWHHHASSLETLAARRGRLVRPWWAQRRLLRYWAEEAGRVVGYERTGYA